MNVIATTRTASARQSVEHFDVLIVGAGISGIGSAYHLTTQLPGTRFVVLEAQESFGGTWLTHRYPGILRQRSSYLRLPLQALDLGTDRHRRGNSRLYGRGHRRKRA
jgi:cation diffusion facilitator CzcD-associated flavoprotein CzcO